MKACFRGARGEKCRSRSGLDRREAGRRWTVQEYAQLADAIVAADARGDMFGDGWRSRLTDQEGFKRVRSRVIQLAAVVDQVVWSNAASN